MATVEKIAARLWAVGLPPWIASDLARAIVVESEKRGISPILVTEAVIRELFKRLNK